MDNNTYERDVALRESSRIQSNDEYFKARPHINASFEALNIFDAGYDRGWQAAQQQSAGEIAELKDKLQFWKNDSATAWDKCEQRRLENEALKAESKKLRDALDAIGDKKTGSKDKWAWNLANEALSATTSSLVEHDNEVIDKCINKLSNGEYKYIQDAIADLESLKNDPT